MTGVCCMALVQQTTVQPGACSARDWRDGEGEVCHNSLGHAPFGLASFRAEGEGEGTALECLSLTSPEAV